MMHSPENYFQTNGSVILPGIDEAVRLPRNVWFRYDGAVPSLSHNLAKTELVIRGVVEAERRGIRGLWDWPFDACAIGMAERIVRRDTPDIDQLAAYCFAHQVHNGRVHAYVIAKRQDLNLSKSIFSDGHESGEFLQKINKQKFVQEILERENIPLDVSRYKGEDFADIPGLLALMKAVRDGVRELHLPDFRNRPALRPEQVKAFGF